MTIGYVLPAPGNNIASDDVIRSIKQGVIPVTTTTHPSDHHQWKTISESDGRSLLQWASATVGYALPWSLPWGNLSNVGSGTVWSGVGAGEVVVSAVGFPIPANRFVRISWRATLVAGVGGCAGAFEVHRISDGTDTPLSAQQWSNYPIPDNQQMLATDVITDQPPAAASTTYYLVALVSGGVDMAIRGDISISQIIVEDIGPAGAPL